MADKRYYSYEIVGLNILCELPYPIEIQNEAYDFLHPLFGDAENFYGSLENNQHVRVSLNAVDSLPPIPPDAVQNDGRYFGLINGERITFMRPKWDAPAYACAIYHDCGKSVELRYLPGYEAKIQISRQLSDLIGMETLFLGFDAFILHASFISYNGQGILFSAPSGTGKSTQADLWKRYKDADIINGDRAGVRLEGDGWHSYGLPYAGSSGIYKNVGVPLNAIVILRQAKHNSIRTAYRREAVHSLYAQALFHRWDSDFTSKIMTLIEKLISDIPVYVLECLPDEDAVELTCRTVFENE